MNNLELEHSTDLTAIAQKLFNHAIATFTHQDNQLTEFGLTCQIPFDLYQIIEKHGLLNLKPELRSSSISFSADTNITLKVVLHPDLYPDLAEHTAAPETALQYLQHLSQTQPDHPLLDWDNWFVLSAHQGDQGYTTLWTSLNPSKFAVGQIPEAKLTQSFSQVLNGFTQLFNVERDRTITNMMIAFFTNDDWTFTKLQGKPMLQMGYRGANGEWNCYTRANEDPQQFTFYSVCPALVPEECKFAISEFITRANSGMIIGNFEFNFDSGEIFYKTSIDVEGDRLTTALIQRLVYTNVAIMDQYLPGIMAVLEEQASPEIAIAQVEAQDFAPNS